MLGFIFAVVMAIVLVPIIYKIIESAVNAIFAIVELIFGILFWPISFFFGPDEPPSAPYIPPARPTFKPPPPESNYTKDWPKVARKMKEQVGWRCEECKVNLGRSHDDKKLLHVHHINLDSKDNRPLNLIALCVICHSTRPGKGHKRLAGAITSDGRRKRVEALRTWWS